MIAALIEVSAREGKFLSCGRTIGWKKENVLTGKTRTQAKFSLDHRDLTSGNRF
jgi:hypothetical protein